MKLGHRKPSTTVSMEQMLLTWSRRAAASGITADRAAEIWRDAIHEATDESRPRIVHDLVRRTPRLARQLRRRNRRFERELRRHYGTALDLLLGLVNACQEVGTWKFDSNRDRPEDHVFVALFSLQARACRTALEVHELLSSGFALGALARCRTLHEISVTASILNEFSTAEKVPDLAERYLAHRSVQHLRDTRSYDENASQLGYEPLGPAELADAKAVHRNALARYGKNFAEDYGWASPLFGGKKATFYDLEKMAELGHLRWHYRVASHAVHADSAGLRMNTLDADGRTYLVTDRDIADIAEPGHMAAISLVQVSISVAFAGDGLPQVRDFLSGAALLGLADEIGSAFNDGATRLRERRSGSAEQSH